MSAPQRAGFERAGATMGSGSGLSVARAIAIAGQTVRVVFSSEPLHNSTAGINDARNGSNYAITILQGSGEPVRSLAVSATIVPYPAYGVTESGEVGLDLQVDRPLVVGLTYQVEVSRAVVSALGEPIGTPYTANFIGAVRPTLAPQLRRKIGLVDLATNPFQAGIVVDSAGDWASHEGVPGTKKRVWRIATTRKGGFVFMPNFGLKMDIKKPATLSLMSTLRTDLTQQILQQPDIVAAATGAVMDSRGFLTITVQGKTSSGQGLQTKASVTQAGVTTS
jgi:hypothetical protein